ncbi:hypothetical protein [Allokutzneria oryzae]|uniref:Uncharacterized protein n=1 Tax=Allokutzneria oryzae TaxID=1378989 RepID=A0ABV6A461_9PSEU
MLAVLYAVAQRVDEHPVLAVTLRFPVVRPVDPDWVALESIGVAGFYGD